MRIYVFKLPKFISFFVVGFMKLFKKDKLKKA